MRSSVFLVEEFGGLWSLFKVGLGGTGQVYPWMEEVD